MKTSRLILLAMLLLFLSGCVDDDPITAPATGNDKGENGNGAWVETGTGVFEFDAIHYWDCVGEEVHNVIYATYTWRLVHLPNGETIYQEHWDTESVVGTLEGMDTGLIWHREQMVAPLVMIRDQVVHYTLNQVFVCEGDGPTVRVHEVYHRNLDGDGEVVQEWDKFRCWEIH